MLERPLRLRWYCDCHSGVALVDVRTESGRFRKARAPVSGVQAHGGHIHLVRHTMVWESASVFVHHVADSEKKPLQTVFFLSYPHTECAFAFGAAKVDTQTFCVVGIYDVQMFVV